MPKIKIVDDILAPRDFINVNFQGKEPFAIVPMIPRLIRDVMKVTGMDIFETDIRWDVTSDPREFYGHWKGKREEDRWTYTRIRVRAQGAQSVKDKMGWVNIILDGTVDTKYEYTNFIQKSFWWFFNYMFYFKQRRRYIDYGKDNIYLLKERILNILGIPKEEAIP